MKFQDYTSYERYLEEPGGATLGWLARYGSGQAIWCGELSRADFRLQSADVREALRDDLGWFLVDYDLDESEHPFSRVLGKAACESAGLELMQLIVQGRLCAAWDTRQTHTIGVQAPVPSRSLVGSISSNRSVRSGW